MESNHLYHGEHKNRNLPYYVRILSDLSVTEIRNKLFSLLFFNLKENVILLFALLICVVELFLISNNSRTEYKEV